MKTYFFRTYKSRFHEHCIKECGQFIKELRERDNITQRELAETIGVSQTYIHYLEYGLFDTASTFLKACEFFCVPFREYSRQLYNKMIELNDKTRVIKNMCRFTGFTYNHIYRFFKGETDSLYLLFLFMEITGIDYYCESMLITFAKMKGEY